jgi:hypothetical protein
LNAYELAEIMEIHDGSQIWEHGLEIANMLRQQADRIAELEKQSKLQGDNKVNDEPVAWMMKAREPSLHCPDYVTFEKPTRDMKISHHPYPLYTHPAKTLTDEEITQCLNESMETKNMWGQPMSELNPVKFARAILRKAQEK